MWNGMRWIRLLESERDEKLNFINKLNEFLI